MQRERAKPPRFRTLVVALVGLAICAIALPSSLAAGRNEGIPGTFVAIDSSCSRAGGCPWRGTFESDDGQISERTTMHSDKIKRPGDQVDAQKVGAEVSKRDSKAWVFMLAGVIGSFAYVLWFIWASWSRRRNETARPEEDLRVAG